jgi:hypothetical protein
MSKLERWLNWQLGAGEKALPFRTKRFFTASIWQKL